MIVISERDRQILEQGEPLLNFYFKNSEDIRVIKQGWPRKLVVRPIEGLKHYVEVLQIEFMRNKYDLDEYSESLDEVQEVDYDKLYMTMDTVEALSILSQQYDVMSKEERMRAEFDPDLDAHYRRLK